MDSNKVNSKEDIFVVLQNYMILISIHYYQTLQFGKFHNTFPSLPSTIWNEIYIYIFNDEFLLGRFLFHLGRRIGIYFSICFIHFYQLCIFCAMTFISCKVFPLLVPTSSKLFIQVILGVRRFSLLWVKNCQEDHEFPENWKFSKRTY